MLSFFTRRKGFAQFYGFEQAALHATEAQLAPEAATRLVQQVELTNKVQRLGDGKEVNLYQMSGGKVVLDPNILFARTDGETQLATVHLKHPLSAAKVKAELWLAHGRVFSLVFDKIPRSVFAGDDWKTLVPSVETVSVWVDPMSTRAKTADTMTPTTVERTWLSEWAGAENLSDFRKPWPEAERQGVLSRIDSQLPEDYRQLLLRTNGVQFGAWLVHGVGEIRKVVLPDNNYYILAEHWSEPEFLATKEGELDGSVYWLSADRAKGQLSGKSLIDAIRARSSAKAEVKP